MKCIKKERGKRFRTLTKGLRLGLGRNLEWEKVFGEKKWFGPRKKREGSRYLSLSKTRLDLRHTHTHIEKRISIDREVSKRYRRQKDLNRSRRYRASVEQTETPK